jgi:hypothetical protein
MLWAMSEGRVDPSQFRAFWKTLALLPAIAGAAIKRRLAHRSRGAVSIRSLSVACVVGIAGLAGCAQTETQWMKVNESYTTAEFQRDHAACSKKGALDDACMRSKGWVDLKPSRGDRAADTPPAPAQDWKQRR